MIVPGSANPLLLGQSSGYNLTRSLRFRSSASAYLSRTPSSITNRQTWTYSTWLKRGALANGSFFSGGTGSTNNRVNCRFSSDAIAVDFLALGSVTTSAVFRDPSSWYHIVIALDTTQATSTNRLKIYVNGVQQTVSFGFTITQNANYGVNNTALHTVGAESDGLGNYLDGYQTEVNFIDGQALTPSSFGETSSTTGVWQPKKYSGTYGTNGFYLPFTDNSALTSGSNAGLGKDFSGNGNYWNTNNISITSGSTYDSMTDVPTLTSATAANFAVINPLWKDSTTVIAQGNLNVSNGNYGGFSTLTIPTNSKFYAEFTVTETEGNQGVGILKASNAYSGVIGQTDMFGSNSVTYYSTNGNKYVLGGGSTAYGSSWGTVGDVIGIAVNTVDNQITFYKNNVSQGTITGLTSGIEWVFATGNQTNTGGGAWNFGQRPFAYTPPTGYVALNTYNLPTPTIGATASSQANKYFDISLYTGTGSTQTITNSGGFSPDFLWAKARSSAFINVLSNRVVGSTSALSSNNTNAEFTVDTTYASNGFTVNSDINANGTTFVGWQWKANGSGSSNTAGSITSTVSANTTSGFSVVTYTGNGSTGATVGHGLGVAPKMIIVKQRNGTNSWTVYQAYVDASPFSYILNLNSTSAKISTSQGFQAASSSTFTIGTDGNVNGNGSTFVAYCFAEVAGFSRIGSYTGNGSSDGPFVYCGFRPKYIMWKRTNTSGDSWWIIDSTRSPENVADDVLLANLSNSESVQTTPIDFLSNGFKMRNGADGSINASGSTYIYMAFAENPFKYSLAR